MEFPFNGDFELIIPKEDKQAEVELGSEITIPCHLSAGAQFGGATDIKWFKGTDLVCYYKNTEVTEGVGNKNRVRLLTEEINKGNVSLSLKEFKESDCGDYLCQVTCGNRTTEKTIKVEDLSKKKKQRNKLKGFTVGAIGLVALPAVGAAFAIGGAVCALHAIAGTALVTFFIFFSMINRTYSHQERQLMERSLQLAVRRCSVQEREAMERYARLTERRNSIELDRPRMSE